MIDRYDEPWKEILGHYLEDFFRLLFPEIHEGIDWDQPVVGLDKELPELFSESEVGAKVADKLFRLQTHSGDPVEVLVHVEVQAQDKPDFAERMFIYNYRAFDRFKRPVVSVAVLGDESPSFHPKSFTACDFGGCTMRLEFPTVKLREYNNRWDVLEASKNPFAVVVMAHLKSQATRGQAEERYRWRRYLALRLYDLGYGKQKVLHLHRFMEWLMTLPAPLKERLNQTIRDTEEEKNVQFVTSIEEEGIQKGRQEGILEERHAALLQVCEAKGFALDPDQIRRIEECMDLEQLKAWLTKAVQADSADQLFD